MPVSRKGAEQCEQNSYAQQHDGERAPENGRLHLINVDSHQRQNRVGSKAERMKGDGLYFLEQ
jgi:hypothetical protein